MRSRYRVGHLLILWDSSGCWIIRVAQNDRYRQTSLSEIRRKTRHSVPAERMDLKLDRTSPAPRESGGWLGVSGLSSLPPLPDLRGRSRSDCLADEFAPASPHRMVRVAFLTEFLPDTRPGIAAGFPAVYRNSATRRARVGTFSETQANFARDVT